MPFDRMHDVSDDVLLVRYANGDAQAGRVLTLRMTPIIYAHAFRMLNNGSETEDVVQEAMLRLWKIAPDWRSGEAKVTTWLYRVVANLCTDRLRQKKGQTLNDAAEPEDSRPSVVQQMQTRDRLEALHAALAVLPERQRQAVVLRHMDELPNPEIAEIMQISIEAVESLIARGKRALSMELAARKDVLGYTDE